jgi:inosine-uridine nucleoside N-ribohydrolase
MLGCPNHLTMPYRSPAFVEARLATPQQDRPVRAVLDTDTYNEVDDQFALAYLLGRSDRVDLKAVHAAPFHNRRSNGPEEGMLRSVDEAKRVVAMCGADTPVVEGSRRFSESPGEVVESPAVDALLDLASGVGPEDEPLYVLTIGAPTNVASALNKDPSLAGRIVVVFLGGNSPMPGVPAAKDGWLRPVGEFNFKQDVHSSRTLFTSQVPLVWVPCWPAATMLTTTVAELEADLADRSAIGRYLTDIVREHELEWHKGDIYGRAKQIWDLGPCAWLTCPEALITRITSAPVLGDDGAWADDGVLAHPVRETVVLNRNTIFRDVFKTLSNFKTGPEA